MSVSVEADVSSPLSDGQSTLDPTISKSSNDSQSSKTEDIGVGQDDKSDPTTPKLHPTAFTVDFGDAKMFDNRRLEELAKKSQARHQRVQSMSASFTRTSPASHRPPMSAKLPRKAQGYNSEGYFSSDQEDSNFSNSMKHRAQNITSPGSNRNIKSPVTDNFQPKRTSKSPIVDSIMSRSDNFTLNPRHGLNLPLRSNSYVKDILYQPKAVVDIDQSPEVLLTDISSPELDILTPDNGLSTPELKSPTRKSRACSETPDLFKKCIVNEVLYIDDDVDRQSNSSAGTYTIEGDNYTEEQKARMSIDRNFPKETCSKSVKTEREPDFLFDYSKCVITKEPRRDIALRSPLTTNKTFDIPKVSKDKNVLEISCCYESPTENDLAAQTSKQIKSTRSYLEKIKNRVRTITEKTFAKSPPKELEPNLDVGNFTSVTTSGVLSSKAPPKVNIPVRRRCSLTKSEIDQTDYVHRVARETSVPVDYVQRMNRDSSVDYLQRLSRESSVPVSLPSSKSPFDDAKFENTALRNVQRAMRNDSGDMGSVTTVVASDQVVGKLSYLSINRCKGGKTWIQDWADSVKKYNNVLGQDDVEERPPLSPRNIPGRTLSPHGIAPSKIPSPVGTLLNRRTPDLIPPQDTETYLQKTQNAITNLQAKLQSSRTSNFSSIPSQLTSSLISEKTAVSRLPVSQLSRSNSLNYRLRRKEHSNDSSPLRSPGHYVITGSSKLPETTKILLNTASRSLDAERRNHDSNMNSPSSDRGHSNSSDDKTLSNRPAYDVNAVSSPHRKTHARHKSFDGRNHDAITADIHNANTAVCLKTVLKNNAEAYPRIDQVRYQGDKKHQRVLCDNKLYKNPVAFGSSIKRSSSFNTVNKNNNYIDGRLGRRSSGQSEEYKDSDESDNGSYDQSQDRYKRQVLRGRIESPDLKSIAPANSPRNSPRCPNTPEMQRKFGPAGLVRNSVRVPKTAPTRVPEQAREGRSSGHQSRRISEPTRQAVLSRLTKSRSSTREVQPRPQELRSTGPKKLSQYRSSSALATKEIELANWKKRSTYDPIKAAQEGRKKQQAKRQECNKDDLSSPSHSSPVHRSQSFHTGGLAAELTPDCSSEETEDEALPTDAMLASTCSDILDCRPRHLHFNYQAPSPIDKKRYEDKRKTYLVDNITPTKENIAFLPKQDAIDKRRTFILDSDTNSTTNGSSPRASSVYSQEKSLTTGASDSDGESGAESAPVVLRKGRKQVQPKQRYSGDYSMSSSTTSITPKRDIQPRYLDISKYKNESSPKNFLRRDPSKTYVGVLPHTTAKPNKQHIEIEQKKQELEKWKRRASYDPRKAAALGKTAKPQPKTASSVLRSQSFHGPVLTSTSLRYQPPDNQINESYDASSDNDF